MAAELLETGLDPERMYLDVYANAPEGRPRLYAEALQTFYRVVEEHSATDLAAEAQKHINFINQKRGGKNE